MTESAGRARAMPAPVFDRACAQVLHHLARVIPMDSWLVTRVTGSRQTVLAAAGARAGVRVGAAVELVDSPCAAMLSGQAPPIVPDTAGVPAYSDCGMARQVPLGAYLGIPVLAEDGTVFGTVCGLNAAPVPDEVREHEELLTLLATLLSTVLLADRAATAAQRRLETARSHAETDALTGLLNRRGWDALVEREDRRLRRFADPAGVLVLDLDELKTVNDRFGHAAGDELLVRAGAALRAAAGTAGTVARIGGDEFAVLVSGPDADQSDRVVARFADTMSTAGVAASVGFGRFHVATGLHQAWRESDEKMYADKRRRIPGPGAAGAPPTRPAPAPEWPVVVPGRSRVAELRGADAAVRVGQLSDRLARLAAGAPPTPHDVRTAELAAARAGTAAEQAVLHAQGAATRAVRSPLGPR